MVDSLFLIPIVLFVFKNRFEYVGDEYLSKDQCNAIKGLLAILVVLTHIVARITSGILLRNIFSYLGYLCVSGFFFFSGYGLVVSYHLKGQKYAVRLLKKSVMLLALYGVYSVIYYACLEHYGLKEIAARFLTGETIAIHSWYIVEIILFYVAFALSLLICKNEKQIVAFNSIVTVLFMGCAIWMRWGDYWYISSLCYPLGMLWCEHRDCLDVKILQDKKKNLLALLLSFLLFALAFCVSGILKFKACDIIWLRNAVKGICSVTFGIFLVLLMTRIRFQSVVLKYLGYWSLDIYLCHGLFEHLLKDIIQSDFLFGLCVLLCSVVFAFIFCTARSMVWKIVNKYHRRKDVDSQSNVQ